MPTYVFRHPQTGEIKYVYQAIDTPHVYIDKRGVEWNREYTVPNIGFDVVFDENSPRDFAEKTGRKKGTIGDLWDRSAELSEKRKDKLGYDPVKEKYIKEYEKLRNGLPHPDNVKKAKKKKWKF